MAACDWPIGLCIWYMTRVWWHAALMVVFPCIHGIIYKNLIWPRCSVHTSVCVCASFICWEMAVCVEPLLKRVWPRSSKQQVCIVTLLFFSAVMWAVMWLVWYREWHTARGDECYSEQYLRNCYLHEGRGILQWLQTSKWLKFIAHHCQHCSSSASCSRLLVITACWRAMSGLILT